MSKGVRVHCMFSVGVPVYVCFDCAKDAKIVLFDKLAGVFPFTPVFVGINSSSVLEANAEGGGEIICWDGDKMIIPSSCGYRYVLSLWIMGSGVWVGRWCVCGRVMSR